MSYHIYHHNPFKSYIPIAIGTWFYTIIFSIGMIKMPCAPLAFRFSITFQKSFSLITECTELQPFSASGKIVGLFIPGKSLQISSSLSFGAFNNTYLLFFAFFTAL